MVAEPGADKKQHMPKNLGDFLRGLAKKAGINIDEDANKAFFANEAFATLEVPEGIDKGIDSSLISLKDAKNNHPDVKNYYTKQTLDTFDKKLDQLMEDLGFSDDDKNVIKLEQSTYNRPQMLIKAVQKLEQAKANADKPDKAAIQKQIDDLHAQLRVATEKVTAAEASFAQKEKDMRINYKLDSMLGAHKTIYDTLDPDVKFTTLRTLLYKKLQDNNAKLDFDENGNFTLLKKDGTNYYGESNQQVNAQQFVEQLLSGNKLLITTSTATQAAGANGTQTNGQNGTAPANASGNNAGKGATSTYKELMANAQKDAAQTSPVMGN